MNAVSVDPVSIDAVSIDQVRRVAELANLELTAAEEPRMARDLNAILGHVAQLAALDTTGIEPMAQVADVLGAIDNGEGDALRQDAIHPSLDRKAVMQSAPETDGRFFKVPKVIER
jgi:aspartyl-tRNA(Asn)/glutamyl-tRNA(Gln) amidotransferase subunit C